MNLALNVAVTLTLDVTPVVDAGFDDEAPYLAPPQSMDGGSRAMARLTFHLDEHALRNPQVVLHRGQHRPHQVNTCR